MSLLIYISFYITDPASAGCDIMIVRDCSTCASRQVQVCKIDDEPLSHEHRGMNSFLNGANQFSNGLNKYNEGDSK